MPHRSALIAPIPSWEQSWEHLTPKMAQGFIAFCSYRSYEKAYYEQKDRKNSKWRTFMCVYARIGILEIGAEQGAVRRFCRLTALAIPENSPRRFAGFR